ncbi:MAG: hypothetical protein KGI49_00845 [Patescibacteria group bacterium]|nr:hypothetical protein [Patescibacteria group bacterium]
MPLTSAILAFVVAVIAAVWGLVRGWTSGRRRTASQLTLDRHGGNPIISPQKHMDWESEGTFNPAAVQDGVGSVHLFYRAIGGDGLSRIGYASSEDGKRIVYRSPYPVFNPTPGFGLPEPETVSGPRSYDMERHPSGGGWGGAEDPRTVRIDNRIYMTYMAFEGWDSMRIAVTSISEDDLKKRRWNWKKPVVISPPKKRNKNWVLFPEKIRGKFAILHGLSPKVMIDYVDSIDDFYGNKHIRSGADHGGWGYSDPSRRGRWDHRMRGTGAPPLRTDLGWLVLYHAIDDRNQKNVIGYNIGAMILDAKDPTKVLYRSPEPILTPKAHYENDGKPGVVYGSGAIIKNGKLMVYYGGGDKHVCIAETPIRPLLDWLTAYGKV